MSRAEWAAERKRRLAIMSRIHGAWIREAYRKQESQPHCDCSRCGLVSPPSLYAHLTALRGA